MYFCCFFFVRLSATKWDLSVSERALYICDKTSLSRVEWRKESENTIVLRQGVASNIVVYISMERHDRVNFIPHSSLSMCVNARECKIKLNSLDTEHDVIKFGILFLILSFPYTSSVLLLFSLYNSLNLNY